MIDWTLTANDIDFSLGNAREYYMEMLALSQLNFRAKASLEARLHERDRDSPEGSYHGIFHLGFLWYCHVKLRCLLGDRNNLVIHQKVANFIASHDAIMKPREGHGVSEEQSAEWWLLCYEPHPGFLLTLEHEDISWVHGSVLATIDHFVPRTDLLQQWCLGLDLIPLAAPPDVFDKNTRLLRTEYSHLTDDEWANGRKGFLAKADKAPVLYQHPVLQRLFERRARANIARVMAA